MEWTAQGIQDYLGLLPDCVPREENLKIPAILSYVGSQLAHAEGVVYQLDKDTNNRLRMLMTERELTTEEDEDDLAIEFAAAVDHYEQELLASKQERGESTARGARYDRLEKLAKADDKVIKLREMARRRRRASLNDPVYRDLVAQLTTAKQIYSTWKSLHDGLRSADRAIDAELRYEIAELRLGGGRH